MEEIVLCEFIDSVTGECNNPMTKEVWHDPDGNIIKGYCDTHFEMVTEAYYSEDE